MADAPKVPVPTGKENLCPPLLSDEVKHSVYIVIAAYNEESCIEQVAHEVRTNYPHVVVVDDGSEDNTYRAACRTATYVLRHAVNRGQGAALQTGIEFALQRGAEIIVTFDADGQHCVEDIQTLIEPIVRGDMDIVLGSRFLGNTENIPLSRRIMLKLAVLFTLIFNRVKLTDAHNGLRAFSRRAAEKIHISLDRMAHASELIDQIRASGLAFCEVPVRIRYTPYSMSKGQTPRGAIRIVVHYILGRMFR